jgi:NADH-quinone oxidoreductase subunit C/D
LTVLEELEQKFGNDVVAPQETRDGVPTAWVPRERAHEVLQYLKTEIPHPYPFLYDLTGIDERNHLNRDGGPDNAFTVLYQLLSFERNEDVRLKIPLDGDRPSIPTITGIWPMANWYERELWDMFGIDVEGHPDLRRILTPPWWKGHALRKDHPARATEIGRFELPDDKQKKEEEALRFEPEKWGLKRRGEDTDFMFLNIGPQHTGTHGVLRLILQLDGEEILDCVPDIGYHHRAKEKMAERQSWHTFIPYTDRVDYLAGVLNNLAYCLSVESLAGIEVPDRVKVIRVMLSELFRIANHLVWYGTFAQDLGQLSPVFYMFTDRERILEIIEAICGGRMHPSWFRIGGVAQDLPQGWDDMIRPYVAYQRKRLHEYDGMVMQNRIFKARTKGIGDHDTETAIEWGVTGPNLRATGFEWDFRKKRPYSGYDQFRFDVPTAAHGDCYDRAVVRVEEMRQSLRIIEQCVDNMPAGPYKNRSIRSRRHRSKSGRCTTLRL